MSKTSMFKYLRDLVGFGFSFLALCMWSQLSHCCLEDTGSYFFPLCYSSNGVDHSENLSVHKPLCEMRF